VGAQIGNELRSGSKQRECRNKPCKRIRRADAQCENDQSILDIISGLNSVIPLVEHLDKRTNKASKQNQRNSYV
jgi:hypothetical protein